MFDDQDFYEMFDENQSDIGQYRFFGLGCTNGVSVCATSDTENDRIHLSSARLVSPKEKTIDEKYSRKING